MFPTIAGPLTCSQTSFTVSQLLLSGPCLYGGSGIRSAHSPDGPGRQEPGAEGFYAGFIIIIIIIFVSWNSSSSLRVDWNPPLRPKVKEKPEQRNLQGGGGRGLLSCGEWRDGEVACSLPA